jgi:CRP-like cAMP-binding protein
MDKTEMRQLAKICERVEYTKGEALIEQGDPATKLIFLTGGECAVSRRNSQAKNPLSPTNFHVLGDGIGPNVEKEGVERLAVLAATAVLGDVDVFYGHKLRYGGFGFEGRKEYSCTVRATEPSVGIVFDADTLLEMEAAIPALEQLKDMADVREAQWSTKRMDVKKLLHKLERADANIGVCAKLVHVKCLGRMAQAHKVLKEEAIEAQEIFENEVKRLVNTEEERGGEFKEVKDREPKLFEEEVIVEEFVDPYQTPQVRDELIKEAALKYAADQQKWVKQVLSPNSKNNNGSTAYFNPFSSFEPTSNAYTRMKPDEPVQEEEVVEEAVEEQETFKAGFSDDESDEGSAASGKGGGDSDDEKSVLGFGSDVSDGDDENDDSDDGGSGGGGDDGGDGDGGDGGGGAAGGGSPATPTPIRKHSSITTTSVTSTAAEDAAAFRKDLYSVMEEDSHVGPGRTVKRGKAVDVVKNFDNVWQSRPKPAQLLALQRKQQEQMDQFRGMGFGGDREPSRAQRRTMRPELPGIVTSHSSHGTEVPTMLACEEDIILRNHTSCFARSLSKNYDNTAAGPALDPARLEQINGIGRVVRHNPFCAFGAPSKPEFRKEGYFPPEKHKHAKKKKGYRLTS